MVVHASGAEKTMPLPTAGKYPGGEKFQPSAPSLPSAPPYSTVVPCKTRKPRKCCMVSSIVCNLLLLAVVIILGIVMITHVKRSKCANKVYRDTQRYNKENYLYQVIGCDVMNTMKMEGPIDRMLDDIKEKQEDEDDKPLDYGGKSPKGRRPKHRGRRGP
uniref:uncharacterized protein LOC120348082 n=1 Tax=Styela clava TaxID=7725 RepID=UPI00193A7944|nr:uncharacterized protein LOC120348082 [Styela clava]